MTELGDKLKAIREKMIEKGMRLLTLEEIDKFLNGEDMEQLEAMRHKLKPYLCPHCGKAIYFEDLLGKENFCKKGIETTSFAPPENEMMPRARIRKDA